METKTEAAETYATKTDISDMETKTEAAETYATKTDISDMETKTEAAETYATKTDISDMETKTEAAETYATKTELDTKQNNLTFDTTPTAKSNNPVTSGGVYSAIRNVEIGSGIKQLKIDVGKFTLSRFDFGDTAMSATLEDVYYEYTTDITYNFATLSSYFECNMCFYIKWSAPTTALSFNSVAIAILLNNTQIGSLHYTSNYENMRAFLMCNYKYGAIPLYNGRNTAVLWNDTSGYIFEWDYLYNKNTINLATGYGGYCLLKIPMLFGCQGNVSLSNLLQ
jgi:hypothetical protein